MTAKNAEDRAYTGLDIKAIDAERRQITGIATTPTPDRSGDIVEPKGAVFKLPIPLLWQHNSNYPIGHVIEARVKDSGIEITAQIARIEEDGELKNMVDKAWQAMKAGLVKGLSIGFRGIESSRIEESYARRFLKWEWLELSAVTIAANGEATIQNIKSIDTALRAASGQGQRDDDAVPGASGQSQTRVSRVVSIKSQDKRNAGMDIAEQIANYEASRAQKAAVMVTIMEESAALGETLDADKSEKYDTAESEIKAIDEHLKRLRALQSAKAVSAVAVKGATSAEGTESRSFAQVKSTKKLEKGILFARYAMCLTEAKGDASKALILAKEHYPDNEDVIKTLEFQAGCGNIGKIIKATVEAGTTLDSTYARPLVNYNNFAGDFVDFLRPQTIVGQFGVGAIPNLNQIPFNVRIAGQTSGGNAQWVGEGAPKPVTGFDFNNTELRWAKIAAIAVLTQELIRFSDPSAERLVRDSLAASVIERMDIDFIDPNKAAVANVSPASIINGLTPETSTGTDAASIREDLKKLWAKFIAARNAPRNAVYIMNSTTALALSLMQNALGQTEFPGITMTGGTFMGVPVIVSDYVPMDSSGSIVILVNASDIWLADDGNVIIDASDQASLQMLDNPTNNSATGTPTTVVSMWQTNSVAFRAERFINWQRRRASGAAYLTGVNWGAE